MSSSRSTIWNGSHDPYRDIPHPRPVGSDDSKTFDLLSAGFSIPHTTLPEAIPKPSDPVSSYKDSRSSVLLALANSVIEAENGSDKGHLSMVDAGTMGAPSAFNGTVNLRNKRKHMAIEALAGKKQCTDTYSKRSQTLLSKGQELEKLTGAYVVIYTARPQTIGERDPGLFISEELRRADSAISKRVFSATGEINGAAIELAQTSRAGGHRSKRSRTDTNGERFTSAEQDASSAVKRSPRPDPEIPLTPRMTPARSMSTTDAHLNARGKQKIEGVGNPLCTRCWSAGLECLCEKPERETAAVTEAGPEHFRTLGDVMAEIRVTQAEIQNALKEIAFYYRDRCTCSRSSSLTSLQQQSPNMQSIGTPTMSALPGGQPAGVWGRSVLSSSEGPGPSPFALRGSLPPVINPSVPRHSQDSVTSAYRNPVGQPSQQGHAKCQAPSGSPLHGNAQGYSFSGNSQPPILSPFSSFGAFGFHQSNTSSVQNHADNGQLQIPSFGVGSSSRSPASTNDANPEIRVDDLDDIFGLQPQLSLDEELSPYPVDLAPQDGWPFATNINDDIAPLLGLEFPVAGPSTSSNSAGPHDPSSNSENPSLSTRDGSVPSLSLTPDIKNSVAFSCLIPPLPPISSSFALYPSSIDTRLGVRSPSTAFLKTDLGRDGNPRGRLPALRKWAMDPGVSDADGQLAMLAKPVVTTPNVRRASESRRKRLPRFGCHYCGQEFTSKHNRDRHVNAHQGIKRFVCELPGCDKAFTSATDRNRHQVQTKHPAPSA